MSIPEAFLIIIIACIIAYLIHYFFQGSSGDISLRHPVESRIDEYLDRKYKKGIDDWALIRKPVMERTKKEWNDKLDHDEKRIQEFKEFKNDMATTLDDLEHRLDLLEIKQGKQR